MPALETEAKILLAIPLLPRIPFPLTLIIETFLRHEIPQIECFLEESKGPFPILVPRLDGLCELRLHASIPFETKGASVFG